MKNTTFRSSLLLSLLLALLGTLLLPTSGVKAAWVSVLRVAGSNRYETAVQLSQLTFVNGSRTVYVSTGTNFADALAAGPVAAVYSGPILLTLRDSLPQVVKDEIVRLQPEEVVILGGPGAVSVAVESELSRLTGAEVQRLAGSDRYETAVRISRYFLPKTSDSVILSTGTNFADALAAGPAAASKLSPILLTHRDVLPASVIEEIRRLQPVQIIILGGEGVISSAVEDELRRQLSIPRIYRIAGANRYETAVRLSSESFNRFTIDEVIITTGSNFADALAAVARFSPIFMSPADCIPDVVLDEIVRIDPSQVIVLGGEQILSARVASLTSCSGKSGFDTPGVGSESTPEPAPVNNPRQLLDPLAPMMASIGEDRTAVIICRVPVNSTHPDYRNFGTTRVDLNLETVTTFANQNATPYFKRISNGRYWPTFQAHSTIDLAVSEGPSDCREQASSVVNDPYTNVIAVDNSTYTGGFAGPGYFDGRHMTASPSHTFRGAYLGGGSMNPIYPSMGAYLLAHELGHTLHWPHSHMSSNHEYDNPLDIMSGGFVCATRYFSTSPCHLLTTIAFNRFLSGWIDESQVTVHRNGRSETVLSTSPTSGQQMLVAVHPTKPGVLLTFEARVNGSIEQGLPHEGVAIHTIDQSPQSCRIGYGQVCPSLWRSQGQALGSPGSFDHLVRAGSPNFTIVVLKIRISHDAAGFKVTLDGSIT